MKNMQPTLKQVDSFWVYGLTVRTQNSDELNENKAQIPGLWQRFQSNTTMHDQKIFGIYNEYESDVKSPYNYTLGVIQNKSSEDFHAVEVKSGNYLVFQARGLMPQVVIDLWQFIWQFFNDNYQIKRTYQTDFESYDSQDEVAIYIGIE